MQNVAEQTISPVSSREVPVVSSFSGRVVRAMTATIVVAAAAHISIPLPFTPVPLTLQPLAVLGVGFALGPVDGFFAMLAYLAEGAAGLPVFSPTGPGGVLQLLGPTGGYLMSYPLVAAVAGGVVRATKRRLPRFVSAVLASSLAVALLFACGAFWLMHSYRLGLYAGWVNGVAPFLPGEAVKVLVAAGIYNALKGRKTNEQRPINS